MSYEILIDRILDEGRKHFEDCEVYLSTNKDTSMEVFKGELSSYGIAESGGLSLRGIYNGNMGYAYTEKLSEDSIDFLIQGVKDSAEYLAGDKEIIYEGSSDYEEIKRDEDLLSIPVEDKINLIKYLEEESLKKDERLKPVTSVYEETEAETYLFNTKGVRLKDKDVIAVAYLGVMAEENGDVKTGSAVKLTRNFEEIDIDKEAIICEAVEDAISSLGAKSIKSDNYDIVFKNSTFGSLLSAFSSVFIAEQVQKGLSLLGGKLNEQIASSVVTIVDDPYLEGGVASSAFDGEGTKTKYKEIVKDGVLTTYLYNWKSALKDKVVSTGNASRGYKSTIGTGISNFYLKPGEKSQDEILDLVGNGLYITSLQGLHSGLNAVSGDFSLSASGYKIEDGNITSPVNQITVSGNFFELFNKIIEVGDDLDFKTGKIGSPTVYVKELSIAGE